MPIECGDFPASHVWSGDLRILELSIWGMVFLWPHDAALGTSLPVAAASLSSSTYGTPVDFWEISGKICWKSWEVSLQLWRTNFVLDISIGGEWCVAFTVQIIQSHHLVVSTHLTVGFKHPLNSDGKHHIWHWNHSARICRFKSLRDHHAKLSTEANNQQHSNPPKQPRCMPTMKTCVVASTRQGILRDSAVPSAYPLVI